MSALPRNEQTVGLESFSFPPGLALKFSFVSSHHVLEVLWILILRISTDFGCAGIFLTVRHHTKSLPAEKSVSELQSASAGLERKLLNEAVASR